MMAKLPQANLCDIPELMRGAHPSANPAQRVEFEQRCRQLRRDEESEVASQPSRVAASGNVTVDELALMFPSLDRDLVRMLAEDAPTPQHAMETMLALVASSSEPTSPLLPAEDLPLGDMNSFPSLTDSDGWQVVSQTQLERDPDEELGSAWRDRAKAIASKPGPTSANTSAVIAASAKKRAEKPGDDAEAPLPETDYEQRHRRGQQRAHNRAQFGRGGKGRGRGAGGYDDSVLDESEEED